MTFECSFQVAGIHHTYPPIVDLDHALALGCSTDEGRYTAHYHVDQRNDTVMNSITNEVAYRIAAEVSACDARNGLEITTRGAAPKPRYISRRLMQRRN